MPRGLRIIFTGQAGVRQRRVTGLLGLRLARERGVDVGPVTGDTEIDQRVRQPDIREVVLTGSEACVESVLTEGERNIEVFLDAGDQRRQVEEWRNAFRRILERVEEAPQRDVFAALHGVYYRKTRFFSIVDFELVRQFRPDLIITLIDDIQTIWTRIRERSEQSPAKTHYRLNEILSWRTTELLFSDILAQETVGTEFARHHNVKNYLLAVKHPVETLYRLLYRPDLLRVYASFHISSVRGAPEGEMGARRAQVDEFRRLLHARYTVFDPVSIDEKILEFAEPVGDQIELPTPGLPLRAARWPLGYDNPLVPEEEGYYPLRILQGDVEDATRKNPETQKSAIDDHIRFRDFRLVDQVDCVAAYRPWWGGAAIHWDDRRA